MSDLLLMRASPLRQILSTPGLMACYLPYMQVAQSLTGQSLIDYSPQGNHAQLGSTAGVDTNDPSWGTNALTFGGDDYCVMPGFAVGRGMGLCIAINLYGVQDVQYFLGVSAGSWGVRYNGTTIAIYVNNLCEWNLTPSAGGDVLFFHWPQSGNPILYVNGVFQGVGSSDIGTSAVLTIIGARNGGTDLPYKGSIYSLGLWSSITEAQIPKISNNFKTLLAGQGVTLA